MFPCSQINEFQSPPHLLNYSCPHCCEWTFPHHDCANFWSLEAVKKGENKTDKAFSRIDFQYLASKAAKKFEK